MTELGPAGVATCTGEYTVVQGDVDAGAVDNTATATGTPPSGPAISSDPASASVPANVTSSLTLAKAATLSGDVNGNGSADVGDTVAYSFTVTNTGTSTLTGVVVNDPKLPAGATCPSTSLAPRASTTCTGTYTVTQADIDAGGVSNTATATGTPPSGPEVTSAPATATSATATTSGLSMTKAASLSGDANGNGLADVGDTVAYSFTVTNTGTTTLTGVVVNDPKLPAGATCPSTSLAPRASTTCTGTYTVTQADIDAGGVSNTATATGTPPSGPEVTSAPATATSATATTSSIRAVMTVTDSSGDGVASVGEQLIYTVKITNTGQLTVSGLTVNDPMLAAKGLTFTCDRTSIGSGETATCVSQAYTVTAADMSTGSLTNTATVTGTTPGGTATASGQVSVTIATGSQVKLDLVKSGTLTDKDRDGKADVGETIVYTFKVRNIDTDSVYKLVIDDPQLAGLTIRCSATTLGPARDTVCQSAPYTVTQADVGSSTGLLSNTATARAVSSTGGSVVSQPYTYSVTTDAKGTLALTKSGTLRDRDGDARADVGETIVYTFTVRNLGQELASSIRIDDPKLAAAGVTISCPVTTLGYTRSTVCQSTPYTVTAADVASADGLISNTAIARGVTPAGAVASPPSTFQVRTGTAGTTLPTGGTAAARSMTEPTSSPSGSVATATATSIPPTPSTSSASSATTPTSVGSASTATSSASSSP